jgi:hypothetical protein
MQAALTLGSCRGLCKLLLRVLGSHRSLCKLHLHVLGSYRGLCKLLLNVCKLLLHWVAVEGYASCSYMYSTIGSYGGLC